MKNIIQKIIDFLPLVDHEVDVYLLAILLVLFVAFCVLGIRKLYDVLF